MLADLILYNFKVIPIGKMSFAGVDILAIHDNKIVFLGPREALGGLRGPSTRTLDCLGGVLLPGFNDAHCHPFAYAVTKRYADCASSQIRGIADIQAMLRRWTADQGEQLWIRGANLDIDLLEEKRYPTRWEIDAAVSHLPVVLVDRAGQHCVLNTMALERCGIRDSAFDFEARGISIDNDSKLPNGIIYSTCEQVARAIPPLSNDELEMGLREVNRELLSHGITSIQDTSWTNEFRHWCTYQGIKENNLLTPRVTMLAGIDALDEFVRLGLRTGAGDISLRLGAIKLALDESSGSGDPPQADLDVLAIRAHTAGFQLAFHVSNLNLLRMSLQTLDVVERNTGRRCYRPRFEHCPICPTSLLPNLAHSGAIVVSQPNLLCKTGVAYARKADQEQLTWIFPYRSLVDSGINLAFSSDSPLTACDPLEGMRIAVTRDIEGGPISTDTEAVTAAQAIDMYTRVGAYCSNEEIVKGSLAPGQLADLVVLDCDGAESVEKILNASVLMTLVDGKLAWAQ